MNYIYLIIAIIILLVICYFLFMRKKNNNTKETKQIKQTKKIKDNEIIPLPIYAYDSEKNLIYVGDINDLERRDNKDYIDNTDDIKEDEVYFQTQEGKLEYKGKIEDLKANQTNSPIAKDYFYLLSNHELENGTNYYVIYVKQK
jgi:hypothetical protein